jgi:hypothetical protein
MKKFKHWNENDRTKHFLEALSASIGITIGNLTKYNSGTTSARIRAGDLTNYDSGTTSTGIPVNDFTKYSSGTTSAGIPAGDLTNYGSGNNETRATRVHPRVAINIAQWVSPAFDVAVNFLFSKI